MTQENKRDLVEKEQDRLWENKKLSDIEKIIADMIKGDNAPYRSYVTYWNRRAYHLNVLFFQEFAKKIIQKIRKEIDNVMVDGLKEVMNLPYPHQIGFAYADKEIRELFRSGYSAGWKYGLEKLKQLLIKFGVDKI